MSTERVAAQRIRLAALKAVLASLRTQYDLLMNGFKFDEARALAPRIEAVEREVRRLAEHLPPAPVASPAPYTVARPGAARVKRRQGQRRRVSP
jgi:hypothetical protein